MRLTVVRGRRARCCCSRSRAAALESERRPRPATSPGRRIRRAKDSASVRGISYDMGLAARRRRHGSASASGVVVERRTVRGRALLERLRRSRASPSPRHDDADDHHDPARRSAGAPSDARRAPGRRLPILRLREGPGGLPPRLSPTRGCSTPSIYNTGTGDAARGGLSSTRAWATRRIPAPPSRLQASLPRAVRRWTRRRAGGLHPDGACFAGEGPFTRADRAVAVHPTGGHLPAHRCGRATGCDLVGEPSAYRSIAALAGDAPTAGPWGWAWA